MIFMLYSAKHSTGTSSVTRLQTTIHWNVLDPWAFEQLSFHSICFKDVHKFWLETKTLKPWHIHTIFACLQGSYIKAAVLEFVHFVSSFLTLIHLCNLDPTKIWTNLISPQKKILHMVTSRQLTPAKRWQTAQKDAGGEGRGWSYYMRNTIVLSLCSISSTCCSEYTLHLSASRPQMDSHVHEYHQTSL